MSIQTSSSISLVVEKKPTEMVQPSKHIPYQVLSLSTLDNDPYNEVVYKSAYVFKAKNVADSNQDDDDQPESLLREALSDLLGYYYPFSGRLKRRESDRKLALSCGGGEGGVAFTVANANVELPSLEYLENMDLDTSLKFLSDLDHADKDGYPPFALQVTKFTCGGFMLGSAFSHAVCDGFGMGHTICALTELASGKKNVTVTPIWERERLVDKPEDDQPPFVPDGDTALSPYLPTDDWVTEKINIRAESIRKLKEATLKEYESSNETLTTFEVIGAYLWKSRVKALSLEKNGVTVLGFAVGIRDVVDPPLPDGYYGNAYIDVYVTLTAKEVEEFAISDIVKLIKEAKRKAHDKDYLQEELVNTEKIIRMNLTSKGKRDGLLVLTDWRNIGIFGSMDFGWGEPVDIIPVVPEETARSVNMFMKPSRLEPEMNGGVQVMVTLPTVAMVKFKEEMNALRC